jgi:hypothetical protein
MLISSTRLISTTFVLDIPSSRMQVFYLLPKATSFPDRVLALQKHHTQDQQEQVFLTTFPYLGSFLDSDVGCSVALERDFFDKRTDLKELVDIWEHYEQPLDSQSRAGRSIRGSCCLSREFGEAERTHLTKDSYL